MSEREIVFVGKDDHGSAGSTDVLTCIDVRGLGVDFAVMWMREFRLSHEPTGTPIVAICDWELAAEDSKRLEQNGLFVLKFHSGALIGSRKERAQALAELLRSRQEALPQLRWPAATPSSASEAVQPDDSSASLENWADDGGTT